MPCPNEQVNVSKLLIRFAKKPDGSTVLACTRADGSQTWQRHHRHAAFFPLHDLSHFAVETTLGLRHGFYGLVAGGWNVTDFGQRPLPAEAAAEALLAETASGLLDSERATGNRYDLEAFNATLEEKLNEQGHALARPVTSAELDAIRAQWLRLASQWAQVPTGGEMDLEFEVVHPSAAYPYLSPS